MLRYGGWVAVVDATRPRFVVLVTDTWRVKRCIVIFVITIILQKIGQHTHLLPICHRDSWYMA